MIVVLYPETHFIKTLTCTNLRFDGQNQIFKVLVCEFLTVLVLVPERKLTVVKYTV